VKLAAQSHDERGLSMKCSVIFVAALATLLVVSAASAGTFTKRGLVTRVIDGDTFVARLDSGKTTKVRLIGINTPELGACYGYKARTRTRTLALLKRVVLKGDATQATRDRYGRLLAYAWIGGRDLDYRLIYGGFGKVYVYSTEFAKVAKYRAAQDGARNALRGLWGACATSTPPPTIPPPTIPPPTSGCHPNYSPCLPIVSDLDCADVRAMGLAPVRVIGSDPYRLDGDNDGWGCE
jgi:endonuclease YncB( thermonuclease family)